MFFTYKGNEEINLKRKRWVEAEIIDQSRVPTIPIEWDAWLRGRREDPPTEEEVMNTVSRMEKGQILNKETKAKTEDPELTAASKDSVPFPTYDDLELRPGGLESDRDSLFPEKYKNK